MNRLRQSLPFITLLAVILVTVILGTTGCEPGTKAEDKGKPTPLSERFAVKEEFTLKGYQYSVIEDKTSGAEYLVSGDGKTIIKLDPKQ